MPQLMRIALPLIAALVGYFLTWFLFGISTVAMLVVVLALALAFAYYSEGRAGIGAFISSLIMLLCIPPLVLSLRYAVQFSEFTAGQGSEGKAITSMYVFGILIVSAIIFLVTYFLIQVRNKQVWFPLAPWFLILGVGAFMYAPAVPVDCRYSQTNYSFGDTQLEKRFSWIKSKEIASLPDNHELTGQKFDGSYFFVSANCSNQKNSRSRIFSFRASHPLLLAYKGIEGFNEGGFAALFDAKTGRKLTQWHKVHNVYMFMRSYHPYALMGEIDLFNPIRNYSYNYMYTLPPEFFDDLKKSPD